MKEFLQKSFLQYIDKLIRLFLNIIIWKNISLVCCYMFLIERSIWGEKRKEMVNIHFFFLVIRHFY